MYTIDAILYNYHSKDKFHIKGITDQKSMFQAISFFYFKLEEKNVKLRDLNDLSGNIRETGGTEGTEKTGGTEKTEETKKDEKEYLAMGFIGVFEPSIQGRAINDYYIPRSDFPYTISRSEDGNIVFNSRCR